VRRMHSKNDQYADLPMSILSVFRGKLDGAKQERHLEEMLAVYYAQLAQKKERKCIVEIADEELLGASAAGNPFLQESPPQDVNLGKSRRHGIGFPTQSPNKQK